MIGFNDIPKILLRNWWIILLTTVAVALSSAYFASQMERVYQATATVELKPDDSLNENQIISLVNILNGKRTTINTIARKATSSAVKEQVATRLGLSDEQMSKANINSFVLPDTSLIEIRSEGNTPELAASISNAIAEELLVTAPQKVLTMEITDLALPPSSPIAPQPQRMLSLGAISGMALGSGLALVEYLAFIYLGRRRMKASAPTVAAAMSADTLEGAAETVLTQASREKHARVIGE